MELKYFYFFCILLMFIEQVVNLRNTRTENLN